MSSDPKQPGPNDELSDEPNDEPNDEIVGVAFRRSVIVLLGLALVAAAGVLIAQRFLAEDPGETTEADVSAPVVSDGATDEQAGPPAVAFTDVTQSAGIDFERTNGATGDKFLPETLGGGCAFLDYDSDGDADLVLVDGRPWDATPPRSTLRLYQNDGSGQFTDVTDAAGLTATLQGMGATVGDWDGDGDPDLFVTGVGQQAAFRNDGGRFVDVTDASGLAQSDEERWTTSATFFDAEGDGDLDLFVCSYVRWSPAIDRAVDYKLVGVGRAYGPPMNYPGDHCSLYINDGQGRFTDNSAAAGIQVTNPATGVPVAKALGVVPIDVDRDGWMDLFVANDTVANFLFRNLGGGTFEEVGVELGLAYGRSGEATGAMGVDAADYRNDGSLGLVIGNFANEMSSLYVTQGSHATFADESIIEGLGAPSRSRLSFGMLFFDYDLDGRLDLLQVNGHLEEEINVVQPSQTYEQPLQLFWNAGPDARATFVEVTEGAGDLFARPYVGRGAAFADIDRDGDLDVCVMQARGAPALLRNDLDHQDRHWLAVRLRGRTGAANRDGVGAWIELEANGQTQRRPVLPTRSYLATVEPVAHFGLGPATSVDALRVLWPSGEVQEVALDGVDRTLIVDEGP